MKIAAVRSIIFITSEYVHLARRSQVALFPTVFTLRETRTYISILNSNNIPSNIEAVVDVSFETALQIPDVNPNDS